MPWRPLFALVLPFVLACTGATPQPNTPSPDPVDPAPLAPDCPGTVETHEGLKPITDEALLKEAIGAPGKGGLCVGQAFEVTAPVKVYRVWTLAKAYTQLGRWWSFSVPHGPVDAYRSANAICPEWSDLDRVSACTLKVGAHVAVGPGQSATCEKQAFPASETNQVFVPNETKDPNAQKVLVEDCNAGEAFP